MSIIHRQNTERRQTLASTPKGILLIGDSAIRNVKGKRIETCCFPEAMITDITNDYAKILADHPGARQLVLHLGSNDSRKIGSIDMQRDFIELFN
jgi:hypothetical protein